ncbi:MAG: SOS response-associated peptidase [Blautia sp.]|nr:SOS response-associated peptidase [Blautia sp.]
MCGRYYIDQLIYDELDRIYVEIEKQIRQNYFQGADEAADVLEDRAAQYQPLTGITTGDIHPSDTAPVICMDESFPVLRMQKWGFPPYKGTGLIFNARSESVREKPMFRDSFLSGRILVPARGFYEWNRQKEKNDFRSEDASLLLMAGLCKAFPEGERFTILTTEANSSMAPVHDRMPVLVGRESAADWLFSAEKAVRLLQEIPPLLKRSSEYEQQTLWSL